MLRVSELITASNISPFHRKRKQPTRSRGRNVYRRRLFLEGLENRRMLDGEPTVTIDQAETQIDPTTSETIEFTAVFNEPVTGFDGTDVSLSGTATGTLTATVAPSGDGMTYDISVTGMTSAGTVIATIPAGAASDIDSNLSLASSSSDNSVEFVLSTSPLVTIEQSLTQLDPATTDPVHFIVTFTDDVTGFTDADVTLSGTAGGTLDATVTPIGSTGAVYDVAVSGMTSDGTVIATIAAGAAADSNSDLSLASTSTDNTISFDLPDSPLVTINQALTQLDPASTGPVHFTVEFTEAVTGFDSSDVNLSGTAGGTLSATVTPIGSAGTTYDVAVSGMTSPGTVIADIDAGAATDIDSNPSAASTSTDNTISFAVSSTPTVVINQSLLQADPASTSPIHFIAVFSEAVTGFDATDVSLSGTAGGTLTATVTPIGSSGTTYDIAVSGMTSAGTVIANINAGAATDIDSNASAASTSTDNTVSFAASATPTVTINQALTQVDPTGNATIHFTAVFSEQVTGFTGTDVTLGGTAGGTLTVTVTPIGIDGTTYDVAVSGATSSGTVIATIAAGVATDLDSNPNAASTSTDNTVTVDLSLIPTVTINQASGQVDPTSTSPVEFTVVFNEAVTGFTGTDVLLSGTAGGTLSATVTPVGVDGTTYEVAVSGMTSSGTVIATVPAGAATDVNGNLNVASTSTDNTITFTSTVAPTATINQGSGQVDPTSSSPITFRVVFSEAVTGFTGTDVSLSGTAGGTLAATVTPVGVDGTTYDVTVTGMTSAGTVIATVPAGAAIDVDSNLNVASTSTDNVVTFAVSAAPTVTIEQASGQLDPTTSSPVQFRVVFSEAVTGFSGSDVLLSGTAGGTLSATVTPVGVDGTTYDVSVSGMTSSGTVIATIPAGVATDIDSNLNVASTSVDNVVTFSVSVSVGDTVGLYDPFNNTFYLNNEVDGSTDNLIVFSTPDVPPNWDPIAGDWDGDGVDTVGLYDPFNNTFYLNNDTDGSIDNLIVFETPSVPANWVAIAGDWDGDGIDTVGLYDPNGNTFYLNNETDGSIDNLIVFTTPDVPPNWLPIAGDWDNDGTDTVGLYSRTTNTFYLNNDTDGSVDNLIVFTTPDVPTSWLPIAGNWDGIGGDTVGLYDPNNNTFYLNNEIDGTVDNLIVFSTPDVPRTWIPIAGNWDGAISSPADGGGDGENGDVTVTINQASGQSDPTITSPILFRVVFGEPVTGFVGADVSLSGTAAGTLVSTVTQVDAEGKVYDVAVTGMTSSGTVIATIAAGVVQDDDSDPNEASTSTDNTVNFNLSSSPTVTINQSATQVDPTTATPIHFRVVFSEAVTGFTNSDVTLSGTAGGTLSATVTPIGATNAIYDVSVSGMTSAGTVIATIAAGVAQDGSGNLNTVSVSTDNVVNFVTGAAPTVTINQASIQLDPTSAATIAFRVVFSEAVTGFTATDVTLSGTAGGTLSATVTPVGAAGTTYDVVVSGMTSSGTVIASINAGVAIDGDGNVNAASTSTDNVVTFILAGLGDTLGLYDPFGNTFYLNNELDGTIDDLIIVNLPDAVPPNWIPIAGDWDGDGDTTIGLYDPFGSTFYLNNETDGSIDEVIVVSLPGVPPHWVPVVGDWDGDGIDTIGLYDRTRTTFHLNNEIDGSTDNVIVVELPDGPARLTPLAGDWDGDGVDTIGLYDKTTNTFRLNNEVDGSVDTEIVFTTPTVPPSWLPVAGDWDNDGLDTVGLYDRRRHTFYLNNETDGSIDNLIVFTTPDVPRSWLPVVGDWDGSATATASVGAFPTSEGESFSDPKDVDGNGTITPMDALNVVNFINTYSAEMFPEFADATSLYDTTGDGLLSPLDVLVIANQLNQEGQSESANALALATDVAEGEAEGGSDGGSDGGTDGGSDGGSDGGGDDDGDGDDDGNAGDDVDVTINQAIGQPDPTSSSPIVFRVVFDEPVTGFVGADVSLSGTASGTLVPTVTQLDAQGKVYNVLVTGMTSSGTVIATIGAGVVLDDDGDPNEASTSTDNTVTFNLTSSPTVTINQAPTQVDPTGSTPIQFRVVFSEAVTGFTASDVSLSGTAGGTLSATVSPIGSTNAIYDVSVSGMTSAGTVIATIAAGVAQDSSGNLNTVSTSTDNVVNFVTGVAPTVTINQAPTQLDPTSGATIRFRVVFSEAVTGFTATDVSLSGTAGGTLSATVTPIGSAGTTYDVVVSGMTSSGTVIASVNAGAAVDFSGNVNTASTSSDNVVTFILGGLGDTLGLYDPSGNTFYLNNELDGTIDSLIIVNLPDSVPANWIPLAGDWDGDGDTTIGLYDPSEGTFYLNNEIDGSLDSVIVVSFPDVPSNWVPVVGDWDGDGVDTIGLFDRTQTTFYLNNEIDGSTDNVIVVDLPDAPSRLTPIAGDWDGDGIDTIGLYDKTTHTFRLNNELDGSVDTEIVFSTPPVPPSWLPVVGDWDGDGMDTVGLYDRRRHTFYLNNETDGSIDNVIVVVTPDVPRSWLPLVGDWDGSATASPSASAFPTSEGESFTDPKDVDGNGTITPMDALNVINFMNTYSAEMFPEFADATSLYDTTGDGLLSPLDVLVIANQLNQAGHGESSDATVLALPTTGNASDGAEGEAAESLPGSDDGSDPADIDWDEMLAPVSPDSVSDEDEDDAEDWLTDLDGILSDIATAVAAEKQQ